MGDELVLKLENIVKKFSGVVALDNVSLEIKKGEIHALMGENGAGKSTLIKTCTGAIKPDDGTIFVNGKSFKYMTPQLSEENGIAVIYQEFNLVDELSAAENIFLGKKLSNGPFINKKAMYEKAKEIFDQLNINISPNKLVRDLTVGYQQMVEIAKAVMQNAQILIMDEPSAPLTTVEIESMFKLIEELNRRGVSIIYISHRLDEIFRISNRITVMRDGKKISTLNTKDTNVDELISLMVGRKMIETFPERKNYSTDEVLLEARNLYGNGIRNISFKLKRGEILGFAGLIGSGRTELMELIFGYKKIDKGEIIFKGKKYLPKDPKYSINNGIVLVPEDRKRQGALITRTIRENITISCIERISKFIFFNQKKDKGISEKFINSLKIKSSSMEQIVKSLSGGNQQKVVLSKCLSVDPDLIIFDEPTRGIDVGAKYEIYKLMEELVSNGKTIIMVSSEMQELIGMSDRIIVLFEGSVVGEIPRDKFSQNLIMSYAAAIN